MNQIRWFLSQEAKRGRIAHRPGHWRLGDEFSKCNGKKIGRDVSEDVQRGFFDPCTSCSNEVTKELLRAGRASGAMAVPGKAI